MEESTQHKTFVTFGVLINSLNLVHVKFDKNTNKKVKKKTILKELDGARIWKLEFKFQFSHLNFICMT